MIKDKKDRGFSFQSSCLKRGANVSSAFRRYLKLLIAKATQT